jgi:peptidyl-lysine (3S)-dioxygenase / protease
MQAGGVAEFSPGNGAAPSGIAPALAGLRREARELWVTTNVPRIPWHPTALDFLRDHVATNSPVVLVDAPVPRWATDIDALQRAAPDAVLDVSWTPDGLGDSILNGRLFVRPHQRRQSLPSFLRALCAKNHAAALGDGDDEPRICGGVPYYSAQNDCLRRELPGLACDDLPDMLWAREAFGCDVDALNLWVGDGRSTTTMHKDHYENCYLVACGEKRFTLRPPVDLPLLHERRYAAATYQPVGVGGSLVSVVDEPPASVAWVTAAGGGAGEDGVGDIYVTLRAGEMLYLPSLWYHAVEQRGVTIALNWWYDMNMNAPAFLYYSFLRRLSGLS